MDIYPQHTNIAQGNLHKHDVIGLFFFTDIFRNDIITAIETDAYGCYGWSVVNGKWNGNTNFPHMTPATVEDVKELVKKNCR